MNRIMIFLIDCIRFAVSLPVRVVRLFKIRSFRQDWYKYAFLVVVLLVLAMIVTTAVSKMYQFWDVGSNSWFDRLKGEGWEFQRGAAVVQQDPLEDPVSSIIYLQQGWKPADSMWFYNTNQGSTLLPYDFFVALEKPGSSEPFRSDENLNRYHYLLRKATIGNPDALPVGFVKDSYKGKDFIGFTCAACHTGQVNYKGTGIRIDGGPAGSDMDSFLKDLSAALSAAQNDAGARTRFIKKVLDSGHYRSEDDVLRDLDTYALRLSLLNIVDHTETAYGYARLDAFGRIYNRVLEHVINQKELKQQLDLTVADLVKEGTLTQADEDSIMEQQKAGGVLSDTRRDHLVLRLSQVLPRKAQLKLMEKVFIKADAPVSYPFLWDIPQHDYVQWNGIGANAGLGPIGRNTGEVIGVFGTLDWAEEPGTSLASFLSGQGIKATHISFKSSINVHNLRLIESRLRSLQSPQWPPVLPPIDKDRAVRGERLFAVYCEACHTRIQRDDPQRRVVAHMSKLADIKTDPKMATNAAEYMGWSGILRNQYVNAGPGDILLDEKAPVAAILTKATLSVVATPENKNAIERGYQWAYELIAELFTNEIKPSLKQGNYDPDTSVNPYSSLKAYKARSLNGIWATAPYLHNGSVPTLYDLLLPKKGDGDPKDGEYRPEQFQVGSREFDPERVGLKSSGYQGFTFDTSRRGNSNSGHNYGTGLDKEKRLDLLEYLKSL